MGQTRPARQGVRPERPQVWCPSSRPGATSATWSSGLPAGARGWASGGGTRAPPRGAVKAGGGPVSLTATEFDLLAMLLRRPGRVFTREELLSEVWGYEAAAGTRTVDVHVAQVRAKLGDASPIRTVRGVGYAADA